MSEEREQSDESQTGFLSPEDFPPANQTIQIVNTRVLNNGFHANVPVFLAGYVGRQYYLYGPTFFGAAFITDGTDPRTHWTLTPQAGYMKYLLTNLYLQSFGTPDSGQLPNLVSQSDPIPATIQDPDHPQESEVTFVVQSDVDSGQFLDLWRPGMAAPDPSRVLFILSDGRFLTTGTNLAFGTVPVDLYGGSVSSSYAYASLLSNGFDDPHSFEIRQV